MQSIKINFFYNALRIISSAVIGLIMMRYVNNVLGAENFGKVEFVNTIINYFLLFSALGIPIYGIREIAKNKDSDLNRIKTLVELLIILFITTIISYIVLVIVLFSVEGIASYKEILILMSSMIFLTNIGAEWYYQGIENQKDITIRFLIIRLLTLLLMFFLVKSRQDFFWYAFIIVLNVCGANFLNFIFLIKTIEFKLIPSLKDLNLKRHLRPILTIFVATISINIYLQLDILMIGSLIGDRYVGYYSVSNKLLRIVISFITIIGTVLLPRLTALYSSDFDLYKIYLKKAFELILIISIPCSLTFYFYANNIIMLLSGKDFIPAIITLKILSPLCVIVGMAYFLGYLILYVQNKEKIYTKAVVASAIFSVSLNYWMIIYFKQDGAAIVAVLAELIAIIYMCIYARKFVFELNIFDKNLIKIIVSTFVYGMLIYVSKRIEDQNIFIILIFLFGCVFTYGGVLYIIKENNILAIKSLIIEKLREHKSIIN